MTLPKEILGTSRQLGQVKPGDTNNHLLYEPSQGVRGTVRAIFVTNGTGVDRTFRIFHDADGTTYSQDTALFYDTTIAANTTYLIDMKEPGVTIDGDIDGTIAARADSADALTFTIYGTEIVK